MLSTMKKLLIIVLCLLKLVNCHNDLELNCNRTNIIDLKTNEVLNMEETCKNRPCVFRQCKLNEIMVKKGKRECKSIEQASKILKKPIELPDSEMWYKKLHHVAYADSRMYSSNCTQMFLVETRRRKYYFFEDGSVLQKEKQTCLSRTPDELKFNKGSFLVEYEIAYIKKIRSWVGPRKIISPLHSPRKEIDETSVYFVVAGMVVSCAFLILVLVIYSWIMELSLVNYMVMAHVAFLTIFFGVKAGQLLGQQNCTTRTLRVLCPIWYYAFLASFFWMNVMAIEIFWSFCGAFEARDHSRRRDFRKFCTYGIYALGMPLAITVFAIIIDSKDPDDVVIRQPCFSQGFPSPFNKPYLYIPMGILLVCNFLIFMMTSYKIYSQKLASSKTLKTSESQTTKKNKDSFVLYLKLMLVTGVNWVMDFFDMPVTLPKWLWYIVNSNAFIGVLIFIIFICDKKVINHLRIGQRISRRNTERSHSSSSKSGKDKNSSRLRKIERELSTDNTKSDSVPDNTLA